MTGEKINLKDIDNEELEHKIIDLNRNQLSNIKRASLLNAIYSSNAIKIQFEDESYFKKENYKDEALEIDRYIEEIYSLIGNFNKDKVLTLRDDIYKKRNLVDGYLVEVLYSGELVDEYGIDLLSNNKEYEHFHRESVDELIDLIHTGLEDTRGNQAKYIFIISEIVKVLPMRMVKKTYYEILRGTIKRNLTQRNQVFVDAQIENYKKQFDSTTRDGYGIEFDYYFKEIHKIKRDNLEKKSLEELSSYVNRVVSLTEELNRIREVLQALGIILNMLIVIDLLEDLEIDESIIDRWRTIPKENNKDLEELNKEIEKDLINIEKNLQGDINYYESLSMEIATREGFNQETLDKELYKTREALAFYNDIAFSSIDFLSGFDMEPVDEGYIQNSIESLFDYMDRSMKGMANRERKIRMRKLMSLVELPFNNIKEFTDYIRYSLDSRIVDKRIINFKINQIIYFLNEVKDK